MAKAKLTILFYCCLIIFLLTMACYFMFYQHVIWGSLILLGLAFIDIIKIWVTYKNMKDRDKNGNY